MRQMVVSSSGPMDEQQKKDMERFAAFIARMIRKYGEEVIRQIEEEEARGQSADEPGEDQERRDMMSSDAGEASG